MVGLSGMLVLLGLSGVLGLSGLLGVLGLDVALMRLGLDVPFVRLRFDVPFVRLAFDAIRAEPWFPWVVLLLVVAILVFATVRLVRHVRMRLRSLFGVSSLARAASSALREGSGVSLDGSSIPRSLNAMDRIFLPQIARDFPLLRVDQLGNQAESLVLASYEVLAGGAAGSVAVGASGAVAIRSLETVEADYGPYYARSLERIVESNRRLGQDAPRFADVHIHNRALSLYERRDGKRIIEFQFAVEARGSSVRYPEARPVQLRDSLRLQFLEDSRMYDAAKGSSPVLALNCPNCGAPLRGIGEESCAYCGTVIKKLQLETWLPTEFLPDAWTKPWVSSSDVGMFG